jgi:hypothetical protein
MSSLVKTLRRWYLTVRGLMNSSAPISGLERPSRARRATCGLLSGELVAGLRRALAGSLARGQQLALGLLGECVHAHRTQHFVCDAQLLAGVYAAALAAQPFA